MIPPLTMPQKRANICGINQGEIVPKSISKQVIRRISGHGKGWVFTPAHFKDLGSSTAVATAIKRYKAEGKIRCLSRGLYDYPCSDPQLGVLAPSVDQVVAALEYRDAVRLQPSGAYAANLMGLTDQVPMRLVFLTDGPTRSVQVGNWKILLKRTTPRNMATAGRITGTVIQALRWLGQKHVDDRVISILRNRLDEQACVQLLRDVRHAPAWIAEIIRAIADGDADS